MTERRRKQEEHRGAVASSTSRAVVAHLSRAFIHKCFCFKPWEVGDSNQMPANAKDDGKTGPFAIGSTGKLKELEFYPPARHAAAASAAVLPHRVGSHGKA